jgi:lipoate-protein ligase A
VLPPLRALNHDEIAPGDNPTGEDLLDRARSPIRIWVPKDKILVLGHSQTPEIELVPENVISDGIPLFRRISGGGAVLLTPGCLCVALRFKRPPSLSIHECFKLGSGVIIRGVKTALGLDLVSEGISDLACGDKKVVGCSLYMPRDFALYLASILVEPDYAGMDRYLAHPSKEPEYRAGRTHNAFVAGLAELAGKTVHRGGLIAALETEAGSILRLLDQE